MGKPSYGELNKYNAYYEPDTEFQAKARYLQSKWLKKHNIPMGTSKENYCGNYYGNFIDEKLAKETECNFLTPKIRAIAKKAIEEGKILEKNDGIYRFICNSLTSQTMCFNLFGEFLDKKDKLVEIFNKLKPNLMDKITEIIFEYSPGCLGDHTTFDVFIEYEKNNEKSFLGIEVKYSEDLGKGNEKVKEKEKRYFIVHKQEYTKTTETCGLFKPDVIDGIRKPPYSQIWRDHLLAIKLKSVQNYTNGYFVFLYPSNNAECKEGIEGYMDFLKNPEESIFELHLEDFIKTIKEKINEDWANELFHRYIEGL